MDAMIEVGFWELAKGAYSKAKVEGKARTGTILQLPSGSDRHQPEPTSKMASELVTGHECVRFQGLRVGYFTLDNVDAKVACLDEGDTLPPGRRDGDRIVFNRIVSLKEDSGKA